MRNEACMRGGKKRTQRFWRVNRKERNRLGDRDVDGSGVRQVGIEWKVGECGFVWFGWMSVWHLRPW